MISPMILSGALATALSYRRMANPPDENRDNSTAASMPHLLERSGPEYLRLSGGGSSPNPLEHALMLSLT